MALICVEEGPGGDSASVLWARTVPCALGSLYVQMASYRGVLFVVFAQDTVSDPSVLRINEATGVTMTSLVLLRDNGAGGSVLARPGITVNDAGVFVVDLAGKTHFHHGNNRFDFEVWRLNASTLAEEANAVNPVNVKYDADGNSGANFEPPLWYQGGGTYVIGRAVASSNDSSGPTVGSRFTNLFKFNADCTWPGEATGLWYTANYLGAGGNLPGSNFHPYHCSSNSSDIFTNSNNRWYHWTAKAPTVVPADNVFATGSTVPNGTGCCFPISSLQDPILLASHDVLLKVITKSVPNPGGSTLYTKTLGTHVLADVTLTLPAALSLLLHRDNRIVVLYRCRVNGADAALLCCFTEEPDNSWTENWRLDLTADADANWTNPRNGSSLRSWAANIAGNGFDNRSLFGW